MKKYSNLLAIEWIDMLSTETLVKLFEGSVSGDGTKEGGFTTAALVISEMAVRGKIDLLDLSIIQNKELLRKVIAEIDSAERSASSRLSLKTVKMHAGTDIEVFAIPPVRDLIREIENAIEAKAKRQKLAEESFDSWRNSAVESTSLTPTQKKALNDAYVAVKEAQESANAIRGSFYDEDGSPIGSYPRQDKPHGNHRPVPGTSEMELSPAEIEDLNRAIMGTDVPSEKDDEDIGPTD